MMYILPALRELANMYSAAYGTQPCPSPLDSVYAYSSCWLSTDPRQSEISGISRAEIAEIAESLTDKPRRDYPNTVF